MIPSTPAATGPRRQEGRPGQADKLDDATGRKLYATSGTPTEESAMPDTAIKVYYRPG
jgi:hypothetical protein